MFRDLARWRRRRAYRLKHARNKANQCFWCHLRHGSILPSSLALQPREYERVGRMQQGWRGLCDTDRYAAVERKATIVADGVRLATAFCRFFLGIADLD